MHTASIYAMAASLGVFLLCLLAVNLIVTNGESYKVASYKDRIRCGYWEQSGCLLNILGKVCTSDGTSESIEELVTGVDNLFLCCCPTPYKCRKSQTHTCNDLLYRYTSGYKEAEDVAAYLVEGIQSTRKQLLKLDSDCEEHLAVADPFAECSTKKKDKKSSGAPFTRQDLQCEMLSWQWEALGTGDKQEFKDIKCPFDKNAKAMNGGKRKGATGYLDDAKIEL